MDLHAEKASFILEKDITLNEYLNSNKSGLDQNTPRALTAATAQAEYQ